MVTYRELDGLSNAYANALIEGGVRPGDRVALIVPNGIEWAIAMLGSSQVGAAVALLNPRWHVNEIRHAVAIVQPSVIVADEDGATAIDTIGVEAKRISAGATRPGWALLDDIVLSGDGSRPESVVEDWADLDVALPFSSGTTGLPKAVRHTHRSLVAATIQWKAAGGIGEDDRPLLFLPLFHIYGTITFAAAISAGAPLTLMPRFDADATLAVIEAEHTTMTFGAAPIAIALAAHPTLEEHDLSSLRYVAWGATPMAPDVAASVSARSGIRWLHAYGSTEAPLLHCNPVAFSEEWRLDTPGIPVSDLEVLVVDFDTRKPIADGKSGEILVRGPQIMAGYLPASADTNAFEDGWLRTGDVGWVEPDGWVHLVDRVKEMIKVNAFQVAPAELEQVLLSHGSVLDCAVFGTPDLDTGEAPWAAVVLADGAAETADELLEYVASQVATYKRLRGLLFVAEIPRTASGKALRRVLRTDVLASRPLRVNERNHE